MLTQLDGRAYRAWLPPPLTDAAAQFKGFDRSFSPPPRATGDERETHGLLIDCIDAVRFREWENQGPVTDATAIAQAIDLLSGRGLQARQFIEANKLVTQTNAPLRTGPAWMDASHPADSWYVAPPGPRVPGLMTELLGFVRGASIHPILATFVASLRLLHIHPFKDGNGRTARCFAVARLRTSGYLGHWTASAIQTLCRTSASEMSQYTLAIRDRNDWRPFLAWIAASASTHRADDATARLVDQHRQGPAQPQHDGDQARGGHETHHERDLQHHAERDRR